MRIPSGAPTSGWLRFQQAYPQIEKYKVKRPPNGTLYVLGFLTITGSFAAFMFLMPQFYKEYYQESQAQKRAAIGATNRDELAQGVRISSYFNNYFIHF